MNKTWSKRITSSKIETRKIGKIILCSEVVASLLQKNKRDYYNNLNGKNIYDTRKFWKVVKTLLSNKLFLTEKKITAEGEEIIKTSQENLNCQWFFINIINNLNISQHSQADPFLRMYRTPWITLLLNTVTILA